VLGDTPGLEDHVKLLDFGLAKLLDKQSALTMGIALGTPNYMAPEQLGEGTVDARADVYASGVLLYELLTGRKPFGADDVGEVLRKQLHEVAPALGSPVKGGTFSAELEAVVARALAKAPEDRFAGAGAMADAIARVPEARSGTPLSGVAVDLLEAQATILARPNPPARAPAGAHPAQTAARDTAASSKGSVWDALVTSAKIVWRGRVPGQAPKARGRKGLAGWLGTAAAVLMPAAFGVYLATSGEPGDDKSGKESERPDAPRGAVPARAASQDRVPPHPEVKTVQGGGAADRAETAVKGPSVEPAKAASAPKSPVQRKTAGNPRERKAPARLGKPASPRTRWGRWRE
jgi:serine/threonine-protein kinase